MKPNSQTTNHEPRTTILSMRQICKRFDAATVLKNVDFELRAGEVHVLAGENGAGKSTLMKILAGAVAPDAGSILLEDRSVFFDSPRSAAACGIAVMYQELSLVESMSVAENILLGREHGVLYPRKEIERRALGAVREVNLDVDVHAIVATLSLASRQLVELARALQSQARIIVMDEPTSALPATEAARLLAIVRILAERGAGIIFISHRMDEIYRVADRISVLRDGESVGTFSKEDCPPEKLIRLMIGRDITRQFPAREFKNGFARLRVLNLFVHDDNGNSLVENFSFTAQRGEIIGLAGLQGSGTHEVLEALYGARGGNASGTVELDHQKIILRAPSDGIAQGIAFVVGDRATAGIIRDMSVEENISLAAMKNFSRAGWLQRKALHGEAESRADEVRLRVHDVRSSIATLSGGNQQKALLARARATRPKILLLDDPTRGVDIGVKQELYELMNAWTADGCTIIFASTDLQELIAMSDRIVVLHRGKCTAEFSRSEATSENVTRASLNYDQ